MAYGLLAELSISRGGNEGPLREEEEGDAHGEGDCRHRQAPGMAEGVVYMVCGKVLAHLNFME